MALPSSLCPVRCVVVPGSVLSCVSTGGRASLVASWVLLVVDIVLGCDRCSYMYLYTEDFRRAAGTGYKEEQVDMYDVREGLMVNGGPARLPIPMGKRGVGESAESRVSCRILKRLSCRGRPPTSPLTIFLLVVSMH